MEVPDISEVQCASVHVISSSMGLNATLAHISGGANSSRAQNDQGGKAFKLVSEPINFISNANFRTRVSAYRASVLRYAAPHRSSHNYEPRCEWQAVAVLSALELLSEGACPQRLSQIARQLCQWKPHRYLIIGSAQKHDMQVFHAQTVIRLLAVTGEDARPATVSTRRALLQTGPALLGSLQCYTLLLNELVYGCHASLQLILPQHLFGMVRAGMHFMLQASSAQAVGFQKVCSSFYHVHAYHHLYKLSRMP